MEQLNWIFELTDKVTAPLRSIKQSFKGLEDNLNVNKRSVDKVGDSINDLRSKLSRMKQGRNQAFRTDQIERYNLMIEDTENKLQKLENLPSKKHQNNWQDVALGINQVSEVIDKVAHSLDFTNEIENTAVNIKRFTKLTGDDLDSATKKVHQLASVYGEGGEEIARAANAMTKQSGGTFEENLALIEKGYKKGANLNNDMLDTLTEYPAFMKKLEIDMSETMAVMAYASEQGIYSDKAIDSLKEGSIALDEMGQSQIDALQGVGLSLDQLKGKTGIERIKMMSEAMEGANKEAKQKLVSEFFKSAGEDAGAFIENFHKVPLELEKLNSVEQSGAGFKSFVAGLQSDFTAMFGNVGQYAQQMSSVTPLIMGLSQAFNWLSNSQKVQSIWTGIVTTAQWALNLALNANPIGLVIIGITALIAGFIWLGSEMGWFGDFFVGFWDGLVGYFTDLVSFWNTYLNPFSWLLTLIDFVFPEAGQAIRDWFGGLQEWIMEWVDKVVGAVTGAFDSVSEFFGFGEDGEVKVTGDVKHEVKADEKQLEKQKKVGITTGAKVPVKTSASGGASGFKSAEKKEITVKIENLIKEFTIKTENLGESVSVIKEKVAEALVGAVRDFEITI